MEQNPTPWFVAIGASGSVGLDDIKSLLDELSTPPDAVVLVVLHRPWDSPSNLRGILQSGCPHPVLIADAIEETSAPFDTVKAGKRYRYYFLR